MYRNLHCLVGTDNKWEGNHMAMMWLDFYKAGNRISNYSTSTVSFGLFTNKLQINARNWTSIIVLSPNNTFYAASSLNRQDKPNPALWLATQTARQNGVRSGPSAVSRKKSFPESHLLNYLFTKLTCYKMAGYWPRSFYASLWTWTPCLS